MSDRNIQTDYYFNDNLIRSNFAKYASKAVPTAVNHMQLNHYGADVAEVHNNIVGKLHAVITYSVVGKMEIIFKRTVKEGV
jgi:hypothetical protein